MQKEKEVQYEFLKNFPRRMKNVGLYAVLIQNSIQKTSWKQFGYIKFDEQMKTVYETSNEEFRALYKARDIEK